VAAALVVPFSAEAEELVAFCISRTRFYQLARLMLSWELAGRNELALPRIMELTETTGRLQDWHHITRWAAEPALVYQIALQILTYITRPGESTVALAVATTAGTMLIQEQVRVVDWELLAWETTVGQVFILTVVAVGELELSVARQRTQLVVPVETE
jgi:hypothetical protein